MSDDLHLAGTLLASRPALSCPDDRHRATRHRSLDSTVSESLRAAIPQPHFACRSQPAGHLRASPPLQQRSRTPETARPMTSPNDPSVPACHGGEVPLGHPAQCHRPLALARRPRMTVDCRMEAPPNGIAW